MIPFTSTSRLIQPASLFPQIPINLNMPSPSARMMEFVNSIPDVAFAFNMEVGAEDHILYSTPGPVNMAARMLYRFGWSGLRDRIAVTFVLPSAGGHEVLSIGIHCSAWGALSASAWKRMMLRHLPSGIVEFPVRG